MSQESQKNQQELEASLRECWDVKALTESPGWKVIANYLTKTIEANNRMWLTIPEGDSRLKDLKYHASVCYSMLSLIENFEVERKKLEDLWLKLEDENTSIPFDVDTQTPLKENV